ncbi:MAG: tetratricopeptide repeat protein [Deltaproteobacteria bacterium]|nr:tetratricopeptide repeat protein [Deltaproteobacteria bacterium]
MTITSPPDLLERAFLGRPARVAVVLALWAALIYVTSLDCGFHFDDLRNVSDNAAIQITSISPAALWRSVSESPLRRPVASLSFALNYYFGAGVAGYHVVNILAHVLTAVGFYLAILSLLGSAGLAPRLAPWRHTIAATAAFLWASNPVHVQAVTYIVQRMAVLAAMFAMWALVAFFRGLAATGRRRALWLGAAVVLWLLGMTSKETAVALPVVLVAGLALRASFARRWYGPGVIGLGAAIAGTGGFAAVMGAGGTRSAAARILGDQPELLWTVPRSFFYHWSLFLLPLPTRFVLFHDLEISTSWFAPPTTMLASVLLGAVVVAPLWLARRSLVLALAVAWATWTFVAELVVLKHNPVFEHRLYLPSLGVALILGAGIAWLRDRWRPRWISAGVAVIVLLMGVGVLARNRVWVDTVSLGLDQVAKAPGRPESYPDLVIKLKELGRQDEAERHYRDLMALPPRRRMDPYWQGVTAIGMGESARAIPLIEGVLVQESGQCKVLGALIEAYARTGRMAEAMARVEAFREVCDNPEVSPWARRLVASVGGFYEDELKARLQSQPYDVAALVSLAGLLLNRDKPEVALAVVDKALAREPAHVEGLTNRGFALLDLGRVAEAQESFERAIAARAAYANAYFGLAEARERLGNFAGARAAYESFLDRADATDPFREDAAERVRRLKDAR